MTSKKDDKKDNTFAGLTLALIIVVGLGLGSIGLTGGAGLVVGLPIIVVGILVLVVIRAKTDKS